MATKLDLIRFSRLYDNEADQFPSFPQAEWELVRKLGVIEDDDDFWWLLKDVPEITPREP